MPKSPTKNTLGINEVKEHSLFRWKPIPVTKTSFQKDTILDYSTTTTIKYQYLPKLI